MTRHNTWATSPIPFRGRVDDDAVQIARAREEEEKTAGNEIFLSFLLEDLRFTAQNSLMPGRAKSKFQTRTNHIYTRWIELMGLGESFDICVVRARRDDMYTCNMYFVPLVL